MQTWINKIFKPSQNYITHIPDEYKHEFSSEISRDNFSRMLFCAVMVLIFESVIYYYYVDRVFDTGVVIASAIILNIIFVPILFIVYKNFNVFNQNFLHIIQIIWLSIMLCWGCALSLVPQDELVSVNTYIMVAFAIASMFYTPPIESLVMYLAVYIAFYYLLPHYQLNNDVVLVLRTNTLLMNIMAWSLSRFVYRMKFALFIDKKIIEEKNKTLKDMLNRDSMTSLLNHDNMYVKLGEEIERAERIQYPLSIMMIDIDDFKTINDRYGHQAGDQVIIKVAQILTDTCRSTDSICRFGGDEYAVIMPDTALRDAGLLAERIRTNISEFEFINGLHITASAGISVFRGENAEELIAIADHYLYNAKYKGKNRFEMADLTYIIKASKELGN